MDTTRNVRRSLKEGEVILKQFRAKTKTLFRSYPGTLCFTDKQLIWLHDDFGGFVSPWELVYINIYKIRSSGKTLILPFKDSRKYKITFNSELEAIECQNFLISMLKKYGPSGGLC